jgi:hypothetical protein
MTALAAAFCADGQISCESCGAPLAIGIRMPPVRQNNTSGKSLLI